MALMSGSSSVREDLTRPLINVGTLLTSFHCDAVVVVIAMTLNGKNIGVSAMLPWCGSTHEEARFDYRRDVSQQHLVDMRGTAVPVFPQ